MQLKNLEADSKTILSIVIPTYNSEAYIQTVLRKVIKFFKDSSIPFELLVVDDGSSDENLKKCLEVKSEFKNCMSVIRLNKNYGQKIATLIGFEAAKGKYIVTFDDDMQHDLNDALSMYKKISNSQYWVISGFYNYDKNTSIYHIIRSIVFFTFNYIFFRGYMKTKYFTSYKIFDKEALKLNHVDNIYHFWDIPPDKIKPIKVKKNNRIEGKSTYTYFFLVFLFLHVIIKAFFKLFTYLLLHVFILLYLFGVINNWYIITIPLLISLLLFTFLKIDKTYHKNIKKEMH